MFELRIPRFFPISSDLTSRVLRQMSEKRARFLQSQAPENIDDQSTESDELLQAVINSVKNKPEASEEEAFEDELWLRENIYHFLARMKRRQRSAEAKQYDITQCFVIGMGNRLGLKGEEETFVLRELATEYSFWLNSLENRTFVAGWGKIVGDRFDANTMRLENLEEPQEARAATDKARAATDQTDFSFVVSASATETELE